MRELAGEDLLYLDHDDKTMNNPRQTVMGTLVLVVIVGLVLSTLVFAPNKHTFGQMAMGLFLLIVILALVTQ